MHGQQNIKIRSKYILYLGISLYTVAVCLYERHVSELSKG